MTTTMKNDNNHDSNNNGNELRLVRLDIDTQQQPIAFMHRDCHVCRSEGFNALSRVEIRLGSRHVMATMNVVGGSWLAPGTIGVSKYAWNLLKATDGDIVTVAHPPPLESLSYLRGKIYGHPQEKKAWRAIIDDIVSGHYSDIQLSALITACANGNLGFDETVYLTEAMTAVGDRLSWQQTQVMDKHCVGGLPGNRTTPLIVAIVAAHGLCIPKTSSRAITSPAGTADTMEMLAPVALALPAMQRVVEQEGGCIVWGGSVNLSPADDIMIRIERVLDIDSEGQLVASVLSKKLAAGATHVLVDIPVGATAKVRSTAAGEQLGKALERVGQHLGLLVRSHISDGSCPVGRGIGPALEAHDLLAVFHNHTQAPDDLRQRALDIAAHLLEMGGKAATGKGRQLAEQTLRSGAAWKKFLAICEAQGGLRQPPVAIHQHPVHALRDGYVSAIDNRVLARLAKLAGAPASAAAGLYLAVQVGQWVHRGDLMFTLHAETPGELAYALDYYRLHTDMIGLSENYP
jgi:thymidine phosphorylase